jgi:hypothetical protein
MLPSREEDAMTTPTKGDVGHGGKQDQIGDSAVSAAQQGLSATSDCSQEGVMSTRISRRDFAKTAAYAALGTVVAGSRLSAHALAKERSIEWAMNATIIDGCSCRLLCPCIFGSPATVGSAATHEHAGHRSCYFNAAFRVNTGHHGNVRLDGLKFWFAGDKGDARIVELTFEPSATTDQREGIRVFLSRFLPLEWKSLTEGPDAKIEWKAGAVRAEARLDGGQAEVVLARYAGATGEGTTVIRNMGYFASTRNDGFNILPVEHLAYRRGPKPAPFEFKGTSGWTITIDMNSKDVAAAK